MKKIYIYYHNDHDGIVAAGILYNLDIKKRFEKTETKFIMVDYTVELNFDEIEYGSEVYFLDYSFSSLYNQVKLIELIDRIGIHSIVWIDHHKTSIGLFEGKDIPGIRNTQLCGAALTYMYLTHQKWVFIYNNLSIKFHEDTSVPIFLKYIDDYDCWKKLYPETHDFHYGLVISHPLDSVIDTLLRTDQLYQDLVYKTIIDIKKNGIATQKYLEYENKEYHVDIYGFEYTLPEENGGYKCFCLNRKGNSLMFGDKIKEYDAVIPFYFNGEKWTYSMFTEKDTVDCCNTAKSFGGGGHTRAAGWISKELIFK